MAPHGAIFVSPTDRKHALINGPCPRRWRHHLRHQRPAVALPLDLALLEGQHLVQIAGIQRIVGARRRLLFLHHGLGIIDRNSRLSLLTGDPEYVLPDEQEIITATACFY